MGFALKNFENRLQIAPRASNPFLIVSSLMHRLAIMVLSPQVSSLFFKA
jgi:hypothetical protein